jgi:nitroimidazol reductase NimA-like FMN-containing flavoprotein (pyridoxamine 5'-phosphate oxidase superfamily)
MTRESELGEFDVDAFLAQPLTARVATDGPTVRPTWYLWEDGSFWILSGPWAKLLGRVKANPVLAITVDVCDLSTGLVRQVIARGRAEVLPFDVERGRRKLARYLGPSEAQWDVRFRTYLHADPAEGGVVWLRLRPTSVKVIDLSFKASGAIRILR